MVLPSAAFRTAALEAHWVGASLEAAFDFATADPSVSSSGATFRVASASPLVGESATLNGPSVAA